jgi:hypothetical protein
MHGARWRAWADKWERSPTQHARVPTRAENALDKVASVQSAGHNVAAGRCCPYTRSLQTDQSRLVWQLHRTNRTSPQRSTIAPSGSNAPTQLPSATTLLYMGDTQIADFLSRPSGKMKRGRGLFPGSETQVGVPPHPRFAMRYPRFRRPVQRPQAFPPCHQRT